MTVDGRNNWQKMIFRVKALHRNIADAVGIISDILTAGDMSNETLMRELIAERRNDIQASVIPSGHTFARRSASQALSVAAYRDEQWHGKTQLQFLNAVVPPFQKDHKDMVVKIAKLKESILNRGGLIINLTADADGLTHLEESVGRLAGRLVADGETASSLFPPR